ncbi:MAG: 4Fe-4S dicluster domain-containing protein [Acidimicrobiales bacterium]
MTQNALNGEGMGQSHVGDTAPLTPMPFGVLLDRVANEFDSRNRIFDLPTGRFWQPDPDVDLSFEFLGRPAASPIGPAAGPHSQLAQNIALSWLGGSRLFELKTVQILDTLEIARPCIDMQTIGYNIEWSQELTLEQSLTEYVKASMLLDILSRWEPLSPHVGSQPGAHVFDMSVGYDLEGISNPRVAAFIDGMRDASAEVEALRAEIPDSFGEFRSLDFTTTLSDTLTLSTFHGCPPDEIEAITKHLIDAHDLDVIVKLNPTLLGYETVADIVNGQLGYADVDVKEQAFVEDLQFDRGIELIGELNQYAKDRGHRFGIKLTNTLVVNNAKQWMPEDTMYLSGPPLHVLAMTLLDRLSTALPGVLDVPGHDGDVMVSFSAGICKENLADSIATGVNPASVCSDLLKPGGYGRLAPMLKALTNEIRDDGCTSLNQWRQHRQTAAVAAGHRGTIAAHVSHINGEDRQRYHLDGNKKLPREVENDLEMFGCVACNFCVTVCPNDAFFSIATPDAPKTADAGDTIQPADQLGDIPGRQQYLLFAELCNECGNCMTFCPENGDPAMIKPRLFTDESVFNGRTGQGFLLGDQTVVGRSGDDENTKIVERLLHSTKGNPLGGNNT